MSIDTIFHCPSCGAPVDENGHQLSSMPAGYKPEDYPQGIVCQQCMDDMYDQPRYVTREMAMDAGEPDMEGMEY